MRLVVCLAACVLALMAGWVSAQPLTAEDFQPEGIAGQVDRAVQVTRDIKYGSGRE